MLTRRAFSLRHRPLPPVLWPAPWPWCARTLPQPAAVAMASESSSTRWTAAWDVLRASASNSAGRPLWTWIMKSVAALHAVTLSHSGPSSSSGASRRVSAVKVAAGQPTRAAHGRCSCSAVHVQHSRTRCVRRGTPWYALVVMRVHTHKRPGARLGAYHQCGVRFGDGARPGLPLLQTQPRRAARPLKA